MLFAAHFFLLICKPAVTTLNKAASHSSDGARKKKSSGLLLYRRKGIVTEVFLVHPGGPFWAKKDEGAWSIPNGEFGDNEEPLAGAKREFEEETGFTVEGEYELLEPVRQPSGKVVHAWAVRADIDATAIRSNTFSIELPKGSGKMREFPEIDRADWFSVRDARRKILKGQVAFLDQVERKLAANL
jgi:predicted NUDIX family NTP pyrophosphohydrolase